MEHHPRARCTDSTVRRDRIRHRPRRESTGTDGQTLIVDTHTAGGHHHGRVERTDQRRDARPSPEPPPSHAGSIVTVTLADETLTGTVLTGGSWSVTSAFLSDGTHRVILRRLRRRGKLRDLHARRSPSTPSRRPSSITGGAAARRPTPTPTITGTSSAAPGTIVTVTIAGQTMTTLVQADGTWNATPTPVGSGRGRSSPPPRTPPATSAAPRRRSPSTRAPPVRPVVRDRR